MHNEQAGGQRSPVPNTSSTAARELSRDELLAELQGARNQISQLHSINQQMERALEQYQRLDSRMQCLNFAVGYATANSNAFDPAEVLAAAQAWFEFVTDKPSEPTKH